MFFHTIVFLNFLVMMTTAATTLEVTGQVGREVMFPCSGSWSTESSSSLALCRETCSSENILIQAVNKKSAVTRRGRYSLVASDGDAVLNVIIKKLRREDEGRYICEGHDGSFNVLYRTIILKVIDASTVPPGSLSFSTSQQTKNELLPEASTHSSTTEASTLPPEEKTSQKQRTSLTDTTVVIIVSVSLALVVCAIIPLILYGNWRSNARASDPPGPSKINADESPSMRLQLSDSEVSSSQDTAQYTAAYQALDHDTVN